MSPRRRKCWIKLAPKSKTRFRLSEGFVSKSVKNIWQYYAVFHYSSEVRFIIPLWSLNFELQTSESELSGKKHCHDFLAQSSEVIMERRVSKRVVFLCDCHLQTPLSQNKVHKVNGWATTFHSAAVGETETVTVPQWLFQYLLFFKK